MEFKVEKGDFVKAVGLVGNAAVQKSNALPILGNILFKSVDKNHIKVIATDLEIGISVVIPAVVLKDGSVTLPSKKIYEIVRELPEGEIEVIVGKNNAVNIKAGKSYFKIMGLGEEDYPKLPEWNPQEAVELDQSLLKESLLLTSFAISHDETRYVLNGVLLSVNGNRIRFVATDGRRLAFVEKQLNQTPKKNFEIIVPLRAIQELNKHLNWEGSVQVIPSQNQVVFVFGDNFLVSRVIEGHFPNYEQVIPKGETTKTMADREEFLQAVRRTSLLTAPDAPAVKLDFVKGKILVSSRSPNLGEAKEELPADMNGRELAIGFNPHYLMDVLKNLDVEKVSLSLTDPDKPGLVGGKEGYLYVIMPMQLN